MKNRVQDDLQVGFAEKPMISPDGSRVGWLALYPNCCTSYPIPLVLVIYKNGRIETRMHGNGQAIFNWTFDDSSDAVFFCQCPTHGDFEGHYVRQKVGNSIPEEEIDWNDVSDPNRALPLWVPRVQC